MIDRNVNFNYVIKVIAEARIKILTVSKRRTQQKFRIFFVFKFIFQFVTNIRNLSDRTNPEYAPF